MISWIITGTVPRLTGNTIIVGSFSSSSEFSQSTNLEGFASSASGSTSSLNTFSSTTAHDEQGSTTYFSSSNTYTATFQSGVTLSFFDSDSQVTGTFSDGGTITASNSTSSSGETTAKITANKQTSTTQSRSSGYFVAVTQTGASDVWTTSETTTPQGLTEVSFYTTDTTQSFQSFSTASRSSQFATTTTLGETITHLNFPDTVIQAETIGAAAEVLFVVTQSSLGAAQAASNAAIATTRHTLSPIIKTIPRPAQHLSTPTSSTAGSTGSDTINVVSLTQTFIPSTTADFNSFPPATLTYQRFDSTTTQQTFTRVTSINPPLQSGSSVATTTVNTVARFTNTVTNQRGGQTFQATVINTALNTVAVTIPAAGSSTSIGPYFIFGASTGPSTTVGETMFSSVIQGNAALPLHGSSKNVGFANQLKYGTIGAVLGSQKGGWLTANETSSGFIEFDNLIYATEGNGRSGTTIFPQTNQYNTVVGRSITWTTSTTANSLIDGATSKKTTTSASFGVAGQSRTQLIEDFADIGIFGGFPKDAETFVQNGFGVCKNKIDGATTFFDGNATTFSDSRNISAWVGLDYVQGALGLNTTLQPIFYTLSRNSTALPPTPLPDF
jgi:hypothetical protein